MVYLGELGLGLMKYPPEICDSDNSAQKNLPS